MAAAFFQKSANGVCTLQLIRITTFECAMCGEVPFKMSDPLNPIIVRSLSDVTHEEAAAARL